MFKIKLRITIDVKEDTTCQLYGNSYTPGDYILMEFNHSPNIPDTSVIDQKIFNDFQNELSRIAKESVLYKHVTSYGLTLSPQSYKTVKTDRKTKFEAKYYEETESFLLLHTIESKLICAHLPPDLSVPLPSGTLLRTFTVELSDNIEISEVEIL